MVSTLSVIRDQGNEAVSCAVCLCIKGVSSNPGRQDAVPEAHSESLQLGHAGCVSEELLSITRKSSHRHSPVTGYQG